jgi:hypothetical protein
MQFNSLKNLISDPLTVVRVTQKLSWIRAALHGAQAIIIWLNAPALPLPALLTVPVNLLCAGLLLVAGFELAKFERWAFHAILFDTFLSLLLTLLFGMTEPEQLISMMVLLVALTTAAWLFLPAAHLPFALCPPDKMQRKIRRKT